MIPGLSPSMLGGGGVAPISLLASVTALTETIVAPSSILPGDILVLNDRALNAAGLPTFVIPSDFSFFAGANDGTLLQHAMSVKRANGSEAGATLTGMVGTSTTDKVLLVFRPGSPASAINFVLGGDSNATISDGDPGARTILAAAQLAPLLVLAGYGSSGTVDPRTFTVGGIAAKDGEVNSSVRLYSAWKIYNSSPADVVIDMADEGNDNVVCGSWLEVFG